MYTIEVNTNAGETFRFGRILSHKLSDGGVLWTQQQDMDTRSPFETRLSGIKSVRVTNFRLGAVRA